jgi:hypothetical protein
MIGGWIELRNEELREFDTSLHIIIMKSRTVGWAGHAVCMERTAYRILVRNPERGSLSLVSTTIEDLLERKNSGSGLQKRDYGRKGSAALTMRKPSIRKSWH